MSRNQQQDHRVTTFLRQMWQRKGEREKERNLPFPSHLRSILIAAVEHQKRIRLAKEVLFVQLIGTKLHSSNILKIQKDRWHGGHTAHTWKHFSTHTLNTHLCPKQLESDPIFITLPLYTIIMYFKWHSQDVIEVWNFRVLIQGV